MNTMHLSAGQALLICAAGMATTFAVLAAIAGFIRLSSLLLSRIGGKKDTEEQKKPARPSDEEAILIAAAAAVCLDTTPDRIAVRRIDKGADQAK